MFLLTVCFFEEFDNHRNTLEVLSRCVSYNTFVSNVQSPSALSDLFVEWTGS